MTPEEIKKIRGTILLGHLRVQRELSEQWLEVMKEINNLSEVPGEVFVALAKMSNYISRTVENIDRHVHHE